MIKACKKCRREGEKLMLKGERCFSAKCSITRRSYQPGQHGPTARYKISEYGRQLREKQKLKRIYGISESDLKNIYIKADKATGNTSELIIQLVESRIDNIIYRCGIGDSRSQARQIVSHNHVLVDNKKISSPSAIIKSGQIISLDKSVKLDIKKIKNSPWIKKDEKKNHFELLHLPNKEEIDININEKLVVEFYSR